MHKSFYASGFLYHLETQQILLQQLNDRNNFWNMVGDKSDVGEDAQQAFQRIMEKFLHVRLDARHIYPVYDYFHNTFKKVHYVFYAEVKELQDFSFACADPLSWFTFKQTAKLPFSEKTKQDIIVSERVINAQARMRAEALISSSGIV